MKEQFVTYEIALRLKELGFDEDCICAYSKSKLLISKISYSSGKDCECKWTKDDDLDLKAPLWQQAIPFLNKKLLEVGYENYSTYYLRTDFSNLFKLEYEVLLSIKKITEK